jgi:DNA-binding beta-propeller fold protein YncE
MQEAAANAVAWDLNKLAFNGGDINWNISAVFNDSGLSGIRFKPDGTLLLAPGAFFADLSTPWDVNTIALNSGVTTESDCYVKADGSAYFDVDGLDVIRQYSLSPAWDFENGTDTLVNTLDVSGVVTLAQGLDFKPDGTKFYVGDRTQIHEYSMSSAWDISTATFVQSFTYTQGATSSHGNIRFKSDGAEFFVAFTNEVHKYTLSSAWDVSTSSYDSTFTAPAAFYTEGNRTPAIDLKPDGTQLFLAYGSIISSETPFLGRIFNVDLGTPWDLSTGSYTTPSSDFINFSFNEAAGIFFKPDGTKLYVIRESTSTVSIVSEYSLSLAWDITTASFSASGSVAAARGIYISPDGTNLYFTRNSNDSVYQYSMSSAWDISSLSFVRTSSVSAQTTTPWDLAFKPDGTKMYVSETAGEIHEYNLSTPWNIGTKAHVQTEPLPLSSLTGIYGMYMREDGGAAYFVVSSFFDISSSIVEAKLTTNWDISTIQKEFDLTTALINASRGVSFKSDGKKMYVLSIPYTRIISYDL